MVTKTLESKVMPDKWCLVFSNNTGVALHATGTNNSVSYKGVKFDAIDAA